MILSRIFFRIDPCFAIVRARSRQLPHAVSPLKLQRWITDLKPGSLQSGFLQTRSIADAENFALESLSNVRDPVLQEDIVKLGLVQDLYVNPVKGIISLTLCLPTLAHPGLESMVNCCKDALNALPWVKKVDITPKSRKPIPSGSEKGKGGLANVEHIIAVSSCKGGVGKSTVAVNLALTLAKQGSRVGLLDADIYGPSLPALINPEDIKLRISRDKPGKLLVPIDYRGVKCLSFGYVSASSGVPGAGGGDAAIMRGAMVTKVITQLLVQTDWGDLDHLIIDMPPGTGDIHITICQTVSLTGAVIITTPQNLSYIDVVKGISMFHTLSVPTFAIVENMSYFVCSHGTRYQPFGIGHLSKIAREYGITDSFQLPLSREIADSNENRMPIVLSDSLSSESLVYDSLSKLVVSKAMKSAHIAQSPKFDLKFNEDSKLLTFRIVSNDSAKMYSFSAYELRRRDIRTGQVLENVDVADHVIPVKLDQKGNYGVGILWSDGYYKDIYTYQDIEKIAELLENVL